MESANRRSLKQESPDFGRGECHIKDMVTIPTNEPSTIIAGDTWQWSRRDLSDYPASSWTLEYYLLKADKQIKITATADGDYFKIVIAASTTAAYPAGVYRWNAYVSKDTERYKVDEGTIEIKPNYAAQTTGYDTRTHIKKVLDAIEAVIEGRATQDHLSYSIAGRSIAKISPEELIRWWSFYKQQYQKELDAEKIASNLGTGRKILTRFL